MDIGWYRDLVIVIYGVVGAIVFIFLAVLASLFFRRTMAILESIEVMAATIEEIAAYAEYEVVKPIIRVANILKVLNQGIDLVGKFFKKREAGKDEC